MNRTEQPTTMQPLRQRTKFSGNRLFWWVIGSLNAIGAIAGYELSGVQGLQLYKLLNVVGQFLTLMGVIILFEILASPRWKSICVNWIAPSILWVCTAVPMGAVLGGYLGALFQRPSGMSVFRFSFSFVFYAGLVLGPFNELVVYPTLPWFKKDIETRWRWMGFMLVLSGTLAQFIAAVIDLLH